MVAVGGELPPEEPEKQQASDSEQQAAKKKKGPRPPRQRGKKYLAARAKVDPQKTYSPQEAAKLVRETSIARFNLPAGRHGGSIELHLVLNKDSVAANVELPHSTGQKKKIEVANDDTIKKLKEGKIDFDVLIATKDFMPKLVPFAKILGPRGLMPSPKNGTLVDDPQKTKKKFADNTLQIKTEKKQPLVHTVIAKVDQPEKEIEENLKAVVDAVGVKSIKKAVISASMGPGIKISVG